MRFVAVILLIILSVGNLFVRLSYALLDLVHLNPLVHESHRLNLIGFLPSMGQVSGEASRHDDTHG